MTSNEFWLLVIIVPCLIFMVGDFFSGKLGDALEKYLDRVERQEKRKSKPKKGGKK